MSNKIRTNFNNVSGNDFIFTAYNKIKNLRIPRGVGNNRIFVDTNDTIANKKLLTQILGINQAKGRIDQISNALIAQNDPQGTIIANKSDVIIKFVNDIVFNTFVNIVNDLLASGYSRTQAVNAGVEVAYKMTKSQYDKVYNVIDPDRFPSKQLTLEFNNTLQLNNLRQAIEYFQ